MQSTTTMQFKHGTKVYSADGQDLGKIDRVVIDPRTNRASDVILRTDGLITEDKVVPIEHVVRAADDVITLSETAAEVAKLPPFEEEHYIRSDENVPRDYVSGYASPLYSYPPIGTPPLSNVPVAPYVEIERNIPSNMAALREGAKVVSSDDKHVGDVDRIYLDAGNKGVTHIVVSHGVLLKERKLIPADWIHEISDNEVKLAVAARFIEHLPKFDE